MHRGHPLLCGTLLGLTWTLLSLLFQGVDWLAAWPQVPRKLLQASRCALRTMSSMAIVTACRRASPG